MRTGLGVGLGIGGLVRGMMLSIYPKRMAHLAGWCSILRWEGQAAGRTTDEIIFDGLYTV